MKTALKLTALLIMLGIFAVVSSNYLAKNPQNVAAERPLIVFVYKTTAGNIEFWKNMTEGIQAAATEFGVDYKIIGALEEADIQGNMDAVIEAIAMNPSAIVLTATDYELLEPYAKRVVDAGILLLTVDSEVAGGYSRCFIATDNIMLGRYMGEEMLARVGSEGKVGIVGHIKGSNTAIERVSGVMEQLISVQNRVLEPVYCDNHAEAGMNLTIDMIKQNPDLTGIIATNELSALGVSMAIEQLGLQDSITVVTCDNSSKQITYLEQGVIDVTVAQRPFNMGYMGVALAHELLTGKGDAVVPEFYDTGCEVITRENMFSMENQKLLFPFRE